jgi:PAS domain S-box-containing protein
MDRDVLDSLDSEKNHQAERMSSSLGTRGLQDRPRVPGTVGRVGRSTRACPLRWLLGLFALVLIAPLLGFGMFATSRMIVAQRTAEEEQLRRTARKLSAEVDRWLRGLIDTLQALTESGSLKEGDFAAFHREASAVMRGTGHAILLVDRDLNQLVNTRVAYGTTLPQIGDRDTAREVFATGKPAIGGIVAGQVTGQLRVPVMVPVIIDGGVRHVAVLSMDPATLSRIVGREFLPDGWLAHVSDGKGRILARSDRYQDFFGKPIPAEMQEKDGGRSGVIARQDLDGNPVSYAFLWSDFSGWRTAVWAPLAALEAPWRQVWLALITVAVLAFTVSLLAAASLGRWLARPIVGAASAADALGRDEPVSYAPCAIAEVNVVGAALAAAAERRGQSEMALKNSERRLRLALDIAAIGYHEADLAAGTVAFDEQAMAILGLSTSVLSIEEWWKLAHPDDRAAIEAAAELALDPAERRTAATEHRIIRQDGELRWIHWRGRAAFDDNAASPRPVRLVGVVMDLTERKRAEEALAQSKQQLQLVADHAPVLIAQCDSQLRYKFVNQRYADLLGRRPADIIGRHAREVLGEQAYAHAARYMEQALAGQRAKYDLELPDTPHGPRLVRVAYAPEFDAAGRTVGWVAAILDITERKQAEAKLARLAAIVESSDDAIISVTLEGRITSWNAGAARIFGYKADEMIGQPITRIIPPELHGEEEQIFARLKRGDRIEHYETTRVAKDGHRIDISLTVSPVHDKAGKVIGASKVARDVTERKRAEEARRTSEALASAVYAAALDAVITIDHRGTVVEWNHAAEQVFGYSRTDAVGREMAELIIPPRLRESHRQGLAHYLASGVGRVLGQLIELPALRADGAEFPVELSIVPIRIQGPPLFTGFARDITDRKRAEERQRLLIAELDHRVRNTLARMSVIVERSRVNATSVDALAAALAGRLSAMARAHARLSRSSWTGARLRELVEEELAPYRSPKNTSVEGPDLVLLPEAARALGMVVHELATNAVKYGSLSTAEGRLAIRWRLAGQNDAAQLHIVWQESDGPTVAASTQQGFGTRLIRNLLRHELGGRVDLTLAPGGVRCEIEVPLTRATVSAPAARCLDLAAAQR